MDPSVRRVSPRASKATRSRSCPALIRNKRATGRPQDLVDVQRLEESSQPD